MRSFKRKLMVVGLIALCPLPAVAETGAAKSDLGDNAALQYWQAFAQMPALSAEQEELLAGWRTASLDDPDVQKLLAGAHSAILCLRRGARMEHCDWGLNYDDGIGMLLPHLTRSRDLARLAALHARSEYEKGNRGALPANATAMMTLARHVGRDPIMICLLVRFGIEGFVVDLVSLYATEIKMPYKRAEELLKELPTAPDLRTTIDAERRFFIEWMIKKLHEEEDREPGAGAKLWQNMLGAEGPAELKKINSFSKMTQCLEDLRPVYRELETVVDLPKKEFDAQYPEFKKRIAAEKPLARYLVPDIEELLAKEHRNKARMAMLLAAIAVNESGPEALKDIKDPFGDGPFQYSAQDGGFELQSKLHFEGKPVTLTIGKVVE